MTDLLLGIGIGTALNTLTVGAVYLFYMRSRTTARKRSVSIHKAPELRRALIRMGWQKDEVDGCVAWLGDRIKRESLVSLVKASFAYLAHKS